MSKRDNPVVLFSVLTVTFVLSVAGLWWAHQFGSGLNSSVENESATTEEAPNTKVTPTPTPISTPKPIPTQTLIPTPASKKLKTAADIANFQVNIDVKFATESAELTDEDKQMLNSLVSQLKEFDQKTVGVRVIGHTNARGEADFNVPLSQERAQAVANYLRSRGVKLKITASGKGASKPLPDTDPLDRRNKRTEIRLVSINS
ncbi:MAG: OmpA family protein [Cyanomargarita calcarea GSE-NOS-MK-12-04C]|jgi:outer membrane protein OmpA-like peptidoglycan-associated protein|uniref:OmpA family protein n=1 Tax=Cyanomargarita calcarea GSE-NOS-MK-12-04C TaxID=2839659 RepID=A0A951QRB6_9CYAN|nr:OmpA family protein [Cyanomargarita calcarea GSE-NOS-MK-12-04C]